MPIYFVEERLVGTAYYTVDAANPAEARRLVRGARVDMDDHRVDHTGRCRVRRAATHEGGSDVR